MGIKIAYDIELESGENKHFEIELSSPGSFCMTKPEGTPPDWAKLDNHKCSVCPLNSEETPYCPVATNLAPYIEEYKDKKSYVDCNVKVTVEQRTYIKKTSLQDGLYSFFGIIFATSGCPILDFLRPMARFHLPFSDIEETMVRSLGFYMLKQYFKKKNGQDVDFELKSFETAYQNIIRVNKDFVERIWPVGTGDAESNSIIALDGFAQLLKMQLEDGLPDIEELFQEPES